MGVNNILFVTLCIFIGVNSISGRLQAINGQVKITIGTTSGCMDTVSLIRDQLPETYALYKDHLIVEFVPWGRSFRNDGTIVCQFGVLDCWANRLHRCVLDMLRGNQDAQVDYMICEFTSRFAFLQGTPQCALEAGLHINDINTCVNLGGESLDLAAEQAALLPMTMINFVPHIVFNDVVDIDLHNQARVGLRNMVCLALAADNPSIDIANC